MSEDERERIAKEHYNIHDDGLKLEAELENKYDDIIDSGWDKLSDAGVDMNSEIQSISRIAHARKMSEVNDKMTKRITEHLNI